MTALYGRGVTDALPYNESIARDRWPTQAHFLRKRLGCQVVNGQYFLPAEQARRAGRQIHARRALTGQNKC